MPAPRKQSKASSAAGSAASRARPARARRTGMLTENVCESVRELIVQGELKPNDRLVESDLARRLNVSRTPVREAIQKLLAEGLVAEAPRKGYVVAKLSTDFIVDHYAVREVLEGLAARLAAQHATELELMQLNETFNQLKQACENNDIPTLAKQNANFHALIAKASRNVVVMELHSRLQDRLWLLRNLNFPIRGRKEEALAEQKKLLDAISAHNAEEAEAAAQLHVRNARRAQLTVLSSRGGVA